MKIIIPILLFAKGGGYRVLSRLADELIDLGHTVDFLCPDNNTTPYFPTNANIWWIDAEGNLSAKNNPVPSETVNALSIQRRLRKALNKIPKSDYDVLIANHSLTTLPAKRSGWASKTLYYVQAYEPEMYDMMGGVKNKILGHVARYSYLMNLFTVVNADLYLNYKDLKSSRVLCPGVDYSVFFPKEEIVQPVSNDKIIFGTVGRWERFKGTRYVIDAFAEIRKKYPNAELHVAFGKAEDFEKYDAVICKQPHGDEALGAYYRSLDYYICAGFFQLGAFHYPVVEAMCCGVPVITTNYYPSSPANAWLTPPCDADAIVAQFEMALQQPELRERKIKQGYVDAGQFDWKAVGLRLNGFLEELVASPAYGGKQKKAT